MQLIQLQCHPIFVPLLCMKWLIDDVIIDFAEKVNIAMLMV